IIASFICLIFGAISLANAQNKFTLNIEVNNIVSNKGKILLGIYNKADNAFDTKAQYAGKIVDAKTGSMKFSFELPAANYAVAVIHDMNNNGILDKNFLGIPKEMYGFSGTASRPVYDDAKFTLNKNTAISIKLN
ncbi:MAG: DUF2141 domain-containing protein, partial [Bacteroidales bacterium]